VRTYGRVGRCCVSAREGRPIPARPNRLEIDRHARRSYGYLGFNSTGAEARGNSALDLVLWDLFGKAVGQPVWQVLGGLSRDRIRIYDTCAGYRYIPGHDIISGILYGSPIPAGS